MNRLVRIFFSFPLFVAATFGVASATDAVSFEGTVSSVGGAAIPLASVTVSGGSGSALRTTTDGHGRYRAIGLEDGLVNVSVERAGFVHETQQCRVSPGDTLRLDVTLYRRLTNPAKLRFRCSIEPQTFTRTTIH